MTSAGSEKGGKGPERSNRVAPPPFRKQHVKSRALLIALSCVLAVTVGVGLLVTVPTYATATAFTIAGQQDASSVLVLLPETLDGRVNTETSVRLQIAGLPAETATPVSRVEGRMDAAAAAQRYGLPDEVTGTLEGNYLAAVVDGLPAGPAPGAEGTAVAMVGRRRLGAIFLGRGLKEET